VKGRIAALAVVLMAAPIVAVEEGVVLTTYQDPIGIPTACVGETDSEVVGMKPMFTRDECVAALGASLYAHALEVDKCIHRPIERREAVAVLSWSYNIGAGAACKSTLIRKLNAGQPFCAELDKWVYAGGMKLRGLVKRRAKERAICEGRA
jgi:lysozyme